MIHTFKVIGKPLNPLPISPRQDGINCRDLKTELNKKLSKVKPTTIMQWASAF